MKSSESSLKKRGYLPEKDLKYYINKPETELSALLDSNLAHERTAAVRILSKTRGNKYLGYFINMLKSEGKLYPKIELCKAIECSGASAIPLLIENLGKIGRNQHRKIALIDTGKKTFPLPRDIAARILIRMGKQVFPYVKNILNQGDYYQKLEAIDVIGHITWTASDYSCETLLINLYENCGNDDLMKWKLIRSFQSFISDPVLQILEYEIGSGKNETLRIEAERSRARLIRRRSV